MIVVEWKLTTLLRQEPWLDAPPRTRGVARSNGRPHSCVVARPTTAQKRGQFLQPFIQAEIKENIKAPRHWPLCGEFTAQMASNAEKVSIWWRHHEDGIFILNRMNMIWIWQQQSKARPNRVHELWDLLSTFTHWTLGNLNEILDMYRKNSSISRTKS